MSVSNSIFDFLGKFFSDFIVGAVMRAEAAMTRLGIYSEGQNDQLLRLESLVDKMEEALQQQQREVPPSLAALAEMERRLESTTGHAARLARFLDEILIANEEYIRSNTAGGKSRIKYQAMEKKTARIRELLKLPVRAKLPECSICGSLDHERAACPESDDDLCSDCPAEGLPDSTRCMPCPRRKKDEPVLTSDPLGGGSDDPSRAEWLLSGIRTTGGEQ